MSIIEKIKQSVERATGLPFYYDTPQTLNVRLDRATYPCAMLHIVTSGAIAGENGIIRERLNVEVLFTTTSHLDFDGVDVENNEIDAMKMQAFKWLLSLVQWHTGLRLVTLNGTNRYYATDDAIYSAYGVNVTLEEIQGVTACDFEPGK
jgi:hypothetical protein